MLSSPSQIIPSLQRGNGKLRNIESREKLKLNQDFLNHNSTV